MNQYLFCLFIFSQKVFNSESSNSPEEGHVPIMQSQNSGSHSPSSPTQPGSKRKSSPSVSTNNQFSKKRKPIKPNRNLYCFMCGVTGDYFKNNHNIKLIFLKN